MSFVCCFDVCGNDLWLHFPVGALSDDEIALIKEEDRKLRLYGINTKHLDDNNALGVRMDPLPRSRGEFLTRLREFASRENSEAAFVLESSYNNIEWAKISDSIDLRTLQEYVVRNTYDGKTFWRIRETPDTIRWIYP